MKTTRLLAAFGVALLAAPGAPEGRAGGLLNLKKHDRLIAVPVANGGGAGAQAIAIPAAGLAVATPMTAQPMALTYQQPAYGLVAAQPSYAVVPQQYAVVAQQAVPQQQAVSLAATPQAPSYAPTAAQSPNVMVIVVEPTSAPSAGVPSSQARAPASGQAPATGQAFAPTAVQYRYQYQYAPAAAPAATTYQLYALPPKHGVLSHLFKK